MSDENNGTPPEGATTTPADAGQTTVPASDERGIDIREIVGLRKELREYTKALTSAATQQPLRTQPTEKPKSEPAGVNDELAARMEAMERRTALAEAFADHGIKPGPQRDFVTETAKYVPATELSAFVGKFLAAQPKTESAPNPTVAAAKPTVPAPVKAPNAGAPGSDPVTHLPENPLLMSKEQVAALSGAELKARAQAMIKGAGSTNPWSKPK